MRKNVDATITATDIQGVYDQIKKYIGKVHPDKFTNQDVVNENNEKTLIATSFLTDLKKELERERATETALVPYDEAKINFENIEYRLIIKENEILSLNNTISKKDDEINRLKARINELEIEYKNRKTFDVIETKNKVIRTFEPKKRSFITAASVTGLIIIYNVLCQLEGISLKLTSYLPIPQNVANIILSVVLILSIFVILYKYIQSSIIGNYLTTIITQGNISEISELIIAGQINKKQIYDYVLRKNSSKPLLTKLLYFCFRINNPLVIEEAVSLTVNYLIENESIEKVNVKNLIQNYKVAEKTLWQVLQEERNL